MNNETTHHYKKATDYEAGDHSKGNTISPNDNQNVHYSSLVDEALEPHSHGTHPTSHQAGVSGGDKSHHTSGNEGSFSRGPGSIGEQSKSSAQDFDSRYSGVGGIKEAVRPSGHSTYQSESESTSHQSESSSHHTTSHHTGSIPHNNKTGGAAGTAHKTSGVTSGETPRREAGSFGEQSKPSAYPHDSRYGAVGGIKETTNPLSYGSSEPHHGENQESGGFSSKPHHEFSSAGNATPHTGIGGAAGSAHKTSGVTSGETPRREAGSFGEQSKSSAYPHDSRYGAVGGIKETTNPLSFGSNEPHQGESKEAGGFSNQTPHQSSSLGDATRREVRSAQEGLNSSAHHSTHGSGVSESTPSQSRSSASHGSSGVSASKSFPSSQNRPEGVRESHNPHSHSSSTQPFETTRSGGLNEQTNAEPSSSDKPSTLQSVVNKVAGATGFAGSSGDHSASSESHSTSSRPQEAQRHGEQCAKSHSTSSRPQEAFRHGEESAKSHSTSSRPQEALRHGEESAKSHSGKSDSWNKPSSNKDSSRVNDVEGVRKSFGSLSTSEKPQSSSYGGSSHSHGQEPRHSQVSGSDPKNPLDVKHHIQKDYETNHPLEGDSQKPNLSDNFNNFNSREI